MRGPLESPQLERYVARAARGLWGERRRIVMQEVRGALEDRIWKHRLAGLDEAEAVQRAMADLGKPEVIARGMARVHALPFAAQLTALVAALGVAGVSLLGHGHAQVVAAPYDPASLRCDYSPSGLEQLRATFGAQAVSWIAPQLQRYGRATLEGLCRESRPSQYVYLDQDSLLRTLRAANVRVTPTVPADRVTTVPPAWYPEVQSWLSFPGSRLAAPLWQPTERGGRRLVPINYFIAQVARFAGLPVEVEGHENPTLRVGNTTLKLGTAETPVLADQFLSATLYLQVSNFVDGALFKRQPKGPGLGIIADPREFAGSEYLALYRAESPVNRFRVALPDGTTIGVLIHNRAAGPQASPVQLYTTTVHKGEILVPVSRPGATFTVTDSYQSLLRVFTTEREDQRVMLLELHSPERLDKLTFDVYPASVAQT